MTDDFDEPAADLDPETVAAVDGAAAQAFAARKARLVQALASGETGVQYEALALFADPLFSLYDLDAADAFRLRAEPDAVADDTVALLETARVLWAFFSLEPAARAHKRAALAAQLVGDDPSDEDWMGLDGLLETVEIHWQALLPEEVAAAQSTGHPVLGFDDPPPPPGVPGRPRGRGRDARRVRRDGAERDRGARPVRAAAPGGPRGDGGPRRLRRRARPAPTATGPWPGPRAATTRRRRRPTPRTTRRAGTRKRSGPRRCG